MRAGGASVSGRHRKGGYPKAYLTHYMVDASVCYMQGSPGKAGERRRRCCLRGWGAPFLSGGSEKCRYRSGCCSQMPCGTSYTTWSDVGSTTSPPRPIASSAGTRARHRLADVRMATITRAPVATRCDRERSSVTIPAGSPWRVSRIGLGHLAGRATQITGFVHVWMESPAAMVALGRGHRSALALLRRQLRAQRSVDRRRRPAAQSRSGCQAVRSPRDEPCPMPAREGRPQYLAAAKRVRADYLPGFFRQPPRGVRVAYWLVCELRDHGWLIHAVGEPIAGGGFIAETPAGTLILHRRPTAGSGSDLADELVHALRQLSYDERDCLRRLLSSRSAHEKPPRQSR